MSLRERFAPVLRQEPVLVIGLAEPGRAPDVDDCLRDAGVSGDEEVPGYRQLITGAARVGPSGGVPGSKDGSKTFRAQFLELGGVLQEWGVQTVYLTITLPSRGEAAFYRKAGLSAPRVQIFRSRTTRKNIEYWVWRVKAAVPAKQEEAEDQDVCRTVRQWCQRQERGRVVVYAGMQRRLRDYVRDPS